MTPLESQRHVISGRMVLHVCVKITLIERLYFRVVVVVLLLYNVYTVSPLIIIS